MCRVQPESRTEARTPITPAAAVVMMSVSVTGAIAVVLTMMMVSIFFLFNDDGCHELW